MNETIKTMMARQSCRKYKDQQITDEELDLILKAGMHAPTGHNSQSPVIIAVQDKELIKKITKMNASYTGNPDGDPYYGAPTIIIVIADKTKGTPVEDGCLAIGNMLNAAHSLGLGGCWINRIREIVDSNEGKELLRSLGLDGEYVGIGSCSIGYPAAEYPPKAPRKDGYTLIVK